MVILVISLIVHFYRTFALQKEKRQSCNLQELAPYIMALFISVKTSFRRLDYVAFEHR